MATELGKRQRSTRLSSGSVKKRSYVEEPDSDEDVSAPVSDDAGTDSEEDFKPVKKGKKSTTKRTGRWNKEESPSSDEFVEEEADDDDSEDDDNDLDGDSVGGGVAEADSGEEEEVKVQGKPRKSTTQQEVIEIVKAPSGRTPRGMISPHLLKFMRDMKDPAKNDRDWFARHKNVYDFIWQNWLDFVEVCMEEMMEKVDDTICWLPPKTLVERIYRDVRFSNDKTPYKRHLSWCLSRNGRKGNFAKYYLAVSAGDTGLHAGMYEPSKEELQNIRNHILTNSEYGVALRDLVKQKEFCKQFGAPPKAGSGKSAKRTSLWGAEDELKRSPKDYAPDHPDIDWLKLKHFTVSHRFTDAEVASEDFLAKVLEVAQAAKPLVDLMNEIIHGAPPSAPADS